MRELQFHFRRSDAPAGSEGSGLMRIRSFVLLAGSVSASSLASRVGRSVLDLPLADSLRLSDVWRRRIRELVKASDSTTPDPELLVLAGESSPMPATVEAEGLPRLRVERDASEYRGTAGALRDLCEDFADDDHVLVGNASQCPDEGLLPRLISGALPGDGVTLGVGRDGAPSGLMLVRTGALRNIPRVGFIDLKEQALPRIAATSGVRVVESPERASPPLRDIRTYLDALRSWHRSGSLLGVSAVNPFEERWTPAFSIVEDGAEVAPSARLHDSVVLAGGVVGPGCEVVRSVVGPGGVVRRKDRVLEQLVVGASDGAPEVRRDR
jgi:hypothetical protein